MLNFVQSHWAEGLVIVLSVIRLFEAVFPNASILKTADSTLSGVGVKDLDGK